jgi:putative glutamine amidotransferase
MKPLIGITSSFDANNQDPPRLRSHLLAGYSDAIYAAGGLPHVIPVPPRCDPPLLDDILACCNGLVFAGGYDLMPSHYGQQPHPRAHLLHPRRDQFELELFRRADTQQLPILAICLGHQVAHVARGGRLIQHVDDLDLSPAICHHLPNDQSAFHDVRVEPDSRLAQIVGGTRLEVNSRHHQIVDREHPGHGLRTVAVSADGVIEASEDCGERFLLTVQWHPEDLLDRAEHLHLFAALVEHVQGNRGR